MNALSASDGWRLATGTADPQTLEERERLHAPLRKQPYGDPYNVARQTLSPMYALDPYIMDSAIVAGSVDVRKKYYTTKEKRK